VECVLCNLGSHPYVTKSSDSNDLAESEELIIIVLHHLSRGAHHVLFVMKNMGIMDYMANDIEMKQNIVLPATLQNVTPGHGIT
ncbi:25693_t:CDS:2, partial [Dentiscutata erythropus]